jgi:hypothetical protein
MSWWDHKWNDNLNRATLLRSAVGLLVVLLIILAVYFILIH